MESRIFPEKGTDNELFERLFNYISYFDKNWVNMIEGVTNEEIENLENMFKKIDKNFKLPKQLYIFLRYMGKNNGGILSYSFCSNCDIENIMDYNRIYLDNLYLNNSEDIKQIIFASDDLYCNHLVIDLYRDEQVLNISREEPYGLELDSIIKYIIEEKDNEEYKSFIKNNDYLIEQYNEWKAIIQENKDNGTFEAFKNEIIEANFFEPSKNDIKFISNSLESLLFKLAFEKYEGFNIFIELKHNLFISKGKSIKENKKMLVEDILNAYNIRKAWFSDGKDYYGFGNRISIYIHFCPRCEYKEGKFILCEYCRQDGKDFGLSGFITGENKELIEEIYQKMQKTLK